MAKRLINATRCEIIKTATKMFLTEGYSKTTAKMICDKIGISTGNLTFYFPTKEHLLSLLITIMCDFQWKKMKQLTDEGASAKLAFCLEIAAMAASCEDDPMARDLYISAYTHPMTLDIIRKSDRARAPEVFGDYCADWRDVYYDEAETIVSGIEFATLMNTEASPALDVRLAGAIGSIMMIYRVPENVWREKVNKVMAMDYRRIGRDIITEFIEYAGSISELELEHIFKTRIKHEK
ncbi:MAG: TetR/AcrR family transcriptional regulator [Clostridia bacterium]|nr:TetR/AcrR family transcriptional regulator [Clostridia bacterium]